MTQLVVSGFEFKAPRISYVPSIMDVNRVSCNNATKLELRVTRWVGWTCSAALCFVCRSPHHLYARVQTCWELPARANQTPTNSRTMTKLLHIRSLHEQFSATVRCSGRLNHVLPSTAHQDQLVLVSLSSFWLLGVPILESKQTGSVGAASESNFRRKPIVADYAAFLLSSPRWLSQ